MPLTHTQFCNAYKERLEELGFEGLTKADVKILVDTLGETVVDSLKRQHRAKETRPAVTIKGIGVLKIATRPARPARMGRNPATGEPLKIKASRESKVLKATPDKAIADTLKMKRRA